MLCSCLPCSNRNDGLALMFGIHSHDRGERMIARSLVWMALMMSAPLSNSLAEAPAQTSAPNPMEAPAESSTSTDFFIMPGSDFDRPGLVPRANLNIGIGHTFGFLKKDPIGDEVTFAYTYENAGSGFWHSDF